MASTHKRPRNEDIDTNEMEADTTARNSGGAGANHAGNLEDPTQSLRRFGSGVYHTILRRRRQVKLFSYRPGSSEAQNDIFVLMPHLWQMYTHRNSTGTPNFTIMDKAKPIYDTDVFPFVIPIKATQRIHSLIPLSRQLQIGANNIETTSFNATPYCYIAEDTEGIYTVMDNSDFRNAETATVCNQGGAYLRSSNFALDTEQNNGMGPLNLASVSQMKVSDTWERSWKWPEHHNLYFTFLRSDNTFDPNVAAYLPYTAAVQGSLPTTGYNSASASWATSDPLVARVGGNAFVDSRVNPIFLFMPYVPALVDSEQPLNMEATVILETELEVVCKTRPEMFSNILAANNNSNQAQNNIIQALPLRRSLFQSDIGDVTWSNFAK